MREKDKRDQGNRKRVVGIKNSTVWWFLQISHKRGGKKAANHKYGDEL